MMVTDLAAPPGVQIVAREQLLDPGYSLALRLLDRALALRGQYSSEYDAGFLEDETISLRVQRVPACVDPS